MTEPDVATLRALMAETGATLIAALDRGVVSLPEVPTAARLAAVLRTGGAWTVDEARRAWRVLSRHDESLRRAGLAVPRPAQGAASAPPVGNSPRPSLALRSDGHIGVADHPYALREALRTVAGATWDKDPRHSTIQAPQWRTPATASYAGALARILAPHDPVYSPRVAALVREWEDWAEHRAILDPAAPMPPVDMAALIDPRRGSPYAHQVRAVEFASRTTASVLAVPMGGGKTAATIAAVNRISPITPGSTKRVVIVCPNKVRGVWPREIRKWSTVEWHVVDGRRKAMRRGAPPQDLSVVERLEQAETNLFDCVCGAVVHAAIFNYEMLAHSVIAYRGQKSPGWVPPVLLDAAIYDEGHRLKSPTGIISKTAWHWVGLFARRIALTGTPMPQHPWDIFGLYRALDPGVFGGLWSAFETRYIEKKTPAEGGPAFPVAIKESERAAFAAKVHQLMYRPTIDLKLPGATHAVREVTLEPKAAKLYADLEKECVGDLTRHERVTRLHDGEKTGTLTTSNLLAGLTRLRQCTGGFLPDDGEEVRAEGKPTKVVRNLYRVSTVKAEHLAQVLDEYGCVAGRDGGPEPVVVYCAFIADLDAVREVAEAAGLRYGEISGRRSTGLTTSSELSPDVDVCGVQIDSGGTGVDLTRSCRAVFYSVVYSAGNFDQALKRSDRPGQKRRVQFTHLVASGTVDEDVYRALADRRSVAAGFLSVRGVDPAVIGLGADDTPADLDMHEVQSRLNARSESEGRVDGAWLPMDEFGADVWGARGKVKSREPEIDAATLKEYGLEDLF